MHCFCANESPGGDVAKSLSDKKKQGGVKWAGQGGERAKRHLSIEKGAKNAAAGFYDLLSKGGVAPGKGVKKP